ncbi:MAG: ribosomal protein S18-alanine N-acetyltransferase [Pseudomonadales bacterium]
MTDFGHFGMEELDQVHAVECSLNAYPWSKQSFIDSIESGHGCYCLRNDGELIAFAVVSQVLDEASLLNLGVSKAHQRKGYARQLLATALQHSMEAGASMCILEVRASNRSAIELYYDTGFYEIGQRPGYYPSPRGREDALQLCMPLG